MSRTATTLALVGLVLLAVIAHFMWVMTLDDAGRKCVTWHGRDYACEAWENSSPETRAQVRMDEITNGITPAHHEGE